MTGSTFDPQLSLNISVLHLLGFSGASRLPWKRSHAYIFQGRSEDSERLCNPSDPSMQFDQRARETFKDSLFCRDHLYARSHTLCQIFLCVISYLHVVCNELAVCCDVVYWPLDRFRRVIGVKDSVKAKASSPPQEGVRRRPPAVSRLSGDNELML